MTLTLGDFAAEALQEQATANALAPEEFVALAARYYLSELSKQRAATKLPTLLGPASDGGATRLAVDLPSASCDELEAVAEREGTSMERLLQHAVLLLIADLDSGQVATRFVQPPGEKPLDYEA
jgi:hypothetical protein